MNFVWRDYDPETMQYIDAWLDDSAVKYTGLDEGFRNFYEYWANEDGFIVGETFWCKVVFEKGVPFAFIACCTRKDTVSIMEIVVAPEKRGKGKGSQLLMELLKSTEIIGFSIHKSEALIFLNNIASQKAFEKAGFKYHHTHKDGDCMYYVYESDSN